MAAGSTGERSSRSLRRGCPVTPFTASSSTSNSARPRASCAPGPRARAILERAGGRPTLFQLLQGVETLGVRMERHMTNTLAVLESLSSNKAVEWVLHPALENHPDHQLAKKLLPG